MKFLFLAIALLFHGILHAQSSNQDNPVTILEKVAKKLNDFSLPSYSYVREMKYHADYYHSKDSASIFVEFAKGLPIGLRYQAKKPGSVSIYDGRSTIRLDSNTMTIDSSLSSAKSMESNSFMYNSLASLRNNIPIIIGNDSIVKALSDTIVAGQKLIAIYFEGAGMYLNSLKGVNHFSDANLRRPYVLLVDKKTMLPYQLIAKIAKGTDDRDFIKVTYRDIKVPKTQPSSDSWTYNHYRSNYKPLQRKLAIPVIQKGANVPAYIYPVYDPSNTDSLSSEQLKGKVVLLEFWFKNCGPCLQAMPHYNDLHQKYNKDGFELVTINIEDSKKDVGFFFDKYPPTYKMLYNGSKLFAKLGFTACPSSLLVDREGCAVKTFFGFDQSAIETNIAQLLKQ